jgi:hypothetical protein
MSPFEALFGRHPRVLGIALEPAVVGNLDEWLVGSSPRRSPPGGYSARVKGVDP